MKGNRRASLFLASVLACVLGAAALFTACANATGTVTGGEVLFDATPPPPATIACEIDADSGSGATWTDLYRDFFGPTGKASCAGDGACHGNPGQTGAKSSAGYVCGADKSACRASMLSTQLVIVPDQEANPEKSGLIAELRRRKPDGTVTGLMPKRPQCIFEQVAIDRIETWIKNGALDD